MHREAGAIREQYMEMALSNFNVGDYFVTLTFKPQLKPILVQRSADLRQYLRILDRKFLGRGAQKRGEKLRRCPVFQMNASQNLHVHMLLGRPGCQLIPQEEHAIVIKQTWCEEMSCGGYVEANDVRPIYDDVPYLTKYIFRDIHRENTEYIDILNWA